jgi:flagellar hook-associated protein 2
MSVSGLVSGLDTASLIAQLMQVEAMPQTQLKSRVTATERMVTALQAINTKVAALSTAAQKLQEPKTWQGAAATSSSPTVLVTASAGALPGLVSFTVDKLATNSFVASRAFTDVVDLFEDPANRVLLVTPSGGDAVPIDLSGKDLAGIVKAINEHPDLGLRATVLRGEGGSQRLQIASRETGADSAFTVAGLGGPLIEQEGSDAKLSLGGGLTVTSPTNIFADLMPGVSIAVSSPGENVTVTVNADAKPTVDAIKAFVDAANAALADIAARSSSGGGMAGAASPLAGDFMLRQLSQKLLAQVSVAGSSPAAAGIQLTRDGRLELDTEKLTEALKDDPATTQKLVSHLAARLQTVADEASKGSESTIALAIKAKQERVTDLNKQVEGWDRRLELRRTSLERQFSALEVALSSMQQQSNWLAGQLAGLPKWSSGS